MTSEPQPQDVEYLCDPPILPDEDTPDCVLLPLRGRSKVEEDLRAFEVILGTTSHMHAGVSQQKMGPQSIKPGGFTNRSTGQNTAKAIRPSVQPPSTLWQ